MPVATAVNSPFLFTLKRQASLKGITAEQLDLLGCKLCLNNTYHLYPSQCAVPFNIFPEVCARDKIFLIQLEEPISFNRGLTICSQTLEDFRWSVCSS